MMKSSESFVKQAQHAENAESATTLGNQSRTKSAAHNDRSYNQQKPAEHARSQLEEANGHFHAEDFHQREDPRQHEEQSACSVRQSPGTRIEHHHAAHQSMQ